VLSRQLLNAKIPNRQHGAAHFLIGTMEAAGNAISISPSGLFMEGYFFKAAMPSLWVAQQDA